MATKMFEVQQKIYAALSNSAELEALDCGTYDYVPEDTPTPYITFGQIHSTSNGTKTDHGEQINVFLEIWSENKGRKDTVQIIVASEKALETEFVIDSTTVIEQKTINRDVMEESYGLYHGTIEFQITLDWEE